jgi:hypothetical protein
MKRARRRICNKTSLILSFSLVFFSIHYNLWDENRKRILSFFFSSQSCSNCTTRILSLWQTTRREEKKRWCWTNAINVQFLFFSFLNMDVCPVFIVPEEITRPRWPSLSTPLWFFSLSEARHICWREDVLKMHSRCLHDTIDFTDAHRPSFSLLIDRVSDGISTNR